METDGEVQAVRAWGLLLGGPHAGRPRVERPRVGRKAAHAIAVGRVRNGESDLIRQGLAADGGPGRRLRPVRASPMRGGSVFLYVSGVGILARMRFCVSDSPVSQTAQT